VLLLRPGDTDELFATRWMVQTDVFLPCLPMHDSTHNHFASQIVANAAQAIFYTDHAGKLVYANRACEGLNIIECCETNIDQLPIDANLLGKLEELRQVALTESKSATRFLSLEYMATRNCAVHCHPLTNGTEQIAGFAYVIEGISPEQVRDQVLVTNLLEHCEDMIYFKDMDSKFLCCSQSLAKRVKAASPEEMVGNCDHDYFSQVSADGFYKDEQGIIRTGKPITSKAESELQRDGTATWVTTSKMPLRGLDGKVIGTFGISRDITEQKKFETELERTNKKLVHASRQAGMAEVATNVLHNVGNVLNSVNTSFQQVQELTARTNIDNIEKLAAMLSDNVDQPNFLRDDERGAQVPSYLKMVAEQITSDREKVEAELASTKRHLEHIKTIVAMQQQFATSSHVIEETNLAQLIEDAVVISSSSLIRHNISLVRDYPAKIVISIDQHQVMQILVNLIRNAKHACQAASRSDAQIKISVIRSDENIQVIVKDNGIGIATDNLLKLFSHGFTTKKNGHGFGLHSGANCAQAMGGSLEATSEGLGQGAAFTLTLPVHPKGARQPLAMEPVAFPTPSTPLPSLG